MTRGPLLLPRAVGTEFIHLEAPPDWDKVFGSSGPLEIEIGCGRGGFALAYARRNPQVRYVAFEWGKKYARHVQQQAEQVGLSHLRVIEADARRLIPRLFRVNSLAQIHLQFPDPWWKRAHQKRAILQPEFARLLFDLVEPGGKFDMRTDVEDRAVDMLNALEGAGFRNPFGPGLFHPRDEADVPSSREVRYLQSGQAVFRALLVKEPVP